MTLPTFDSLLEQHDSYELGNGLSLGRRAAGRWVVYLDGMWLDGHADPKSEVRTFDTAREAFVWLQTHSGILAVERALAAREAVRS